MITIGLSIKRATRNSVQNYQSVEFLHLRYLCRRQRIIPIVRLVQISAISRSLIILIGDSSRYGAEWQLYRRPCALQGCNNRNLRLGINPSSVYSSTRAKATITMIRNFRLNIINVYAKRYTGKILRVKIFIKVWIRCRRKKMHTHARDPPAING